MSSLEFGEVDGQPRGAGGRPLGAEGIETFRSL